MALSEVLNWVLGGGLVTALVGIVSLRATLRKANADADKAKAESERVRIDNTEQATRILMNNIVEPLTKELNATRKDLQSTKREMARLRKAVNDANRCKHHDECPVLDGLRQQEAACGGSRVEDCGGDETCDDGQCGAGGTIDGDGGACAGGECDDEDSNQGDRDVARRSRVSPKERSRGGKRSKKGFRPEH